MIQRLLLFVLLSLHSIVSAQTTRSSLVGETGPLTIQSDGAFSFGADNGTITGGTDGQFVFTVGGVLQIPFDAAAGGSVLVGRQEIDDEPFDETALLLLLKRPTSLVAADLAGEWNVVELELKTNANQVRLEMQRSTFTLSVDGTGAFQIQTGTGTMSPDGNGRVQVALGADLLLFDISAGKDVMAGVESVSDGTIYLRLLTRQPTTVSAAPLVGGWRFNELALMSVTNRDYTRINVSGESVTLGSDFSFSVGGQNAGTWGVTNSPPGVFLFESADPWTNVLAANVAGDVVIEVTTAGDTNDVSVGVAVRSPASAAAADLTGEWGLTRLAIRHVQNSALIWVTNLYQGGEIQDRFEGRYVDGVLVKEGEFAQFDVMGRHLVLAVYTNNLELARTNIDYHTTGETNSIQITLFRPDGSQIAEEVRTYQTNEILTQYTLNHYFDSGQPMDRLMIGFYPDGGTNTLTTGTNRDDGTRISSLEVVYWTNGVVASWEASDYGTDDQLMTVTNYTRRVDGTLAATRFTDHAEPGVREVVREFQADGIALISVARWLKGEFDGRQETFHANGQVAMRRDYVAGQSHGVWQEWRSDGTRVVDAHFARNRPHGEWRSFDEADRLVSFQTWEYGVKRAESYWTYSVAGVNTSVGSWRILTNGDRESAATNRFDNGTVNTVVRQLNDQPHGENLRYYFETGNLQFREHYESGELHGTWESFFADGQTLHQVGVYQNGLKHGQWEERNQEGALLSRYNYEDGDLSGAFTGWNPEGTTNGVGLYRDGVLLRQTSYDYFIDYSQNLPDGLRTDRLTGKTEIDVTTSPPSTKSWSYHENSQLATYQESAGGTQHGLFQQFSEQGIKVREETWFGGQRDGLSRTWDTNGLPVTETEFRLGRRHGRFVRYHADSQTIAEVAGYVEDRLSGRRSLYHPNGRVSAREDYRADELHGRRETFDDQGFRLSRENYAGGLLEGLSEYFSNGRLAQEIRYVAGRMHGNRVTYDANGNQWTVTPYVNGVIHGTATTYDPQSGDVVATLQYVDGLEEGLSLLYSGGRLVGRDHFQSGHRHGLSERWDDLGRPVSRGDYRWGAQSGLWTSWSYDEQGNSQTDTFDHGAGNPQPELTGVVVVTVTDATGKPLGGRSFGPFTTAKNGVATLTFQLGGSLSTNITLELPGYQSRDLPVSLSPGDYLERSVVLSPKKWPQINRVVTLSGDHFMHGVPVPIGFKPEVDWGDMTAGYFIVRINGVELPNRHYPDTGGVVMLNAGAPVFQASASRADNQVEFVAVSNEGPASPGYPVNLIMYPVPEWLKKLGGVVAGDHADGEKEYRVTVKFPKPKLSVNAEIAPPVDFDVKLESSFGLEARIDSNGKGGVRALGKSKLEIKGARNGAAAEGKITGGVPFRFDYGGEGGPVWEEALEIGFVGRVKLTEERPLLSVFPTLAVAETLPLIGPALKVFNNQAKMTAELGGLMSGKVPLQLTPANDVDWGAAKVKVGLEAGLGVKLDAFDTLKVALKGTALGAVNLNFPPSPDYYESGEFTIQAEASVEIFNVEQKFSAAHTWTYPAGLAGSGLQPSGDSTAGVWRPMDVSFASHADYDRLIPGGRQTADLGANSSLLVQNISPRSHPVIATRNGRTMILYADLDPNDSVTQGNDIGFIYDDGNGMSNGRIKDDTAGEFAPAVTILPDGRVLAAWERVNNPTLTGTNLVEFAGAMEIVWSLFDPATGLWLAPRALTTNTWFDHSPRWIGDATGAKLMWQANQGNELIGTPAAPTRLEFATWNGAEMIPSAINTPRFTNAFHFAGYSDDNGILIAWAQDLDGDLITATDREIFLRDLDTTKTNGWDSPFQLTINSVPDVRPFFARGGTSNDLFWRHEGALVRLTDRDIGQHKVIAKGEAMNDSTPAGAEALGDGELLVYWPRVTGTNVSLWGRLVSDYHDDAPVSLVAVAGQVSDVSVVAFGGGQLGMLYNRDDPAEDLTQLHWRRASLAPDVTVTELRLTAGTVAPGNTVSLTCDLVNRGLGRPETVTLTLYAGDPDQGAGVLTSQSVALSGGSATSSTFNYELPTDSIPARVVVVADPENQIAELIETNNRTSLDLQLPNITIARGGITFLTSNQLHSIELTVVNEGAVATPASTVAVRVNDGFTTNSYLEALSPHATTHLTFTLDLLSLLTNGPVELAITADPGNTVNEADELDNELRLRATRISEGFSDVDGDGVDDNWELRHFAGLSRDGVADRDGDGVSDRDEFIADTDPNDPSDRLFIDLLRDADGTRVQWNARPGRTYRIELIDNLGGTNNWQTGDDDRRPSGFTTRREEFQDDGATGIRFYRVRIVP